MHWLESVVFLGIVIGLAKPVGLYLARVFEDRPSWLRLGLPGDETEWQRLTAALSR